MFFFALVLILKTNEPASELSRNSYALAALFMVLAKLTAIYSLRWVPYPTQVVGKGVMSRYCSKHESENRFMLALMHFFKYVILSGKTYSCNAVRSYVWRKKIHSTKNYVCFCYCDWRGGVHL